jgi:hypothetical protein
MALSVFVQGDGFNFQDTVPETPGLHPAVKFAYRPCSGLERDAYLATPPVKAADAAYQLILDHVEGPTLTPIETDPATGAEVAGEPVALRREHLKKLQGNLWTGIINRILGLVGPSVTPAKN